MIYIICGPTCSGKTEIAKRFSDYFSAPIVNADAYQIYKDMNIGTAKISKDDPYYLRHYLLDIKEPSEEFSVMEYQKMFREVINDLSKKYKDIVVCGGTGLYIRASIYDYVFNQEEKDDVSDLEKMSNEELYDLLKSLDIKATEKIHQNNRKRVIRAISIARNQKLNKSETIDKQEHKIIYDNVEIIFINPDRTQLYEKINERVDFMLKQGLVDEVKSLLNKYKLSRTSKEAIGYKEVIDYLNGLYSLEECQELIKKRTRNYAKRQVTFFKHQFETKMFVTKEEIFKEYLK